MPLYPLGPWLALAALIAVGLADLFDADARKGLMATAATVILSVGYYRVAVHRSGSWSHKGPSSEVAPP
jgi:L-asparagine transporter-like permease